MRRGVLLVSLKEEESLEDFKCRLGKAHTKGTRQSEQS